MQRMTFDLAPKTRPSQAEQGPVALDDLEPGEQLVVAALRAARGGAPTLPQTEGRQLVVAAIDGYADELASCAVTDDPGAVDPRTVNSLEALTLHAIACMQSGLLGEAWKALRRICPSMPLDRAMARLDEVAHALARGGDRVARWRFDDGAVCAGQAS
jgi:hypothetical protein